MDELIKKLIENECILIDKYKHKNKEYIKYKCKCGNIYNVRKDSFMKDKKIVCKYCNDKKIKEEMLNNIKQYAEDNVYVLISKEYINAKEKLHFICNNGHDCYINWNNFKSGRRCNECNKNNISNRLTKYVEDDIKKNIEKEGYLIIGEYKNTNLPFLTICPHGKEYMLRYSHFLEGVRCGCETVKKYEFEEVKEYFQNEGYTLLEEEYLNVFTKMKVECPKGHIYYVNFHNFKSGYRCPNCNSSKGEDVIDKILNNYNIQHIRQYKFDDCKCKQCLPFDFYLPDYNMLIEYDGRQHYEIVEYFGGFDSFVDTKIRDTIKNEYCKKNNIKLIRIPYWEFDNIKNILVDKLNLK